MTIQPLRRAGTIQPRPRIRRDPEGGAEYNCTGVPANKSSPPRKRGEIIYPPRVRMDNEPCTSGQEAMEEASALQTNT
ncbi:hypothetical protein VTK73DRAFT_4665 [Phialemonium thermophilum]|uniref:Uncharacterized protein n=1 Tax=Phialemonium thermophilum TaxID=223376 RepID=A0ABR3V7W7_9PEZI